MGAETTLLSVISAFLLLNMVVGSHGEGGCQLGTVGMSSEEGTGKSDTEDKPWILKDKLVIRSAHVLARRIVEVTRMLKAGKKVLKET